MDTKQDNLSLQIEIAELEMRLDSQKIAKKNSQIEIMRLNQRISIQETTLQTLEVEMKKTQEMILKAKGGEK